MNKVMKNSENSGGTGFFGILFIVFLILKLTDVIDWSWWWITAPLWGLVVIFIVGFLIWLLSQLIFGLW